MVNMSRRYSENTIKSLYYNLTSLYKLRELPYFLSDIINLFSFNLIMHIINSTQATMGIPALVSCRTCRLETAGIIYPLTKGFSESRYFETLDNCKNTMWLLYSRRWKIPVFTTSYEQECKSPSPAYKCFSHWNFNFPSDSLTWTLYVFAALIIQPI